MECEKDNEIKVETYVENRDTCREILDLDMIFNKNIEERIEKLEKKTKTINKIGNIVCSSMSIIYIACIQFMPVGKMAKESMNLFDSPPVISFLFWHFYYFTIVQVYLWGLLSGTEGKVYKLNWDNQRTSSYSNLYPEELRRLLAILLPYIFISFTYVFSDAWRHYYTNVRGIPLLIGWATGNPQSFTFVPNMNRLCLHLLLSSTNVLLLVLTFSLRRYKVWLVEKIVQERAQIRERKDLE